MGAEFSFSALIYFIINATNDQCLIVLGTLLKDQLRRMVYGQVVFFLAMLWVFISVTVCPVTTDGLITLGKEQKQHQQLG